MKYLKNLLLLILFFPFIVLAETKNVEIKSIEQVSISEDVKELKPAEFSGLKLNFNIQFTQKDDFIKYKIVLLNNSDKDYEIDNSSSFNKGEFIRYDYTLDGNKKILKSKEELIMYITITYFKEVEESAFQSDGTYKETNNVIIELSNEDVIENPVMNFIVNPKTSPSSMIIITIVLISSILTIILLLKNRKSKMFILLLLLTIPLTVFALEKLKIEVETYIEIKKGYTGFIYRANEIVLTDDSSIKVIKKWCNSSVCYKTKDLCEENSPNDSTCQKLYMLEEDNTPYYVYPYYLKHNVVNDIITETYVCDRIKDYCVIGGKNIKYEEDKESFLEAFQDDNCSIEEDHIYCSVNNNRFSSDGTVRIGSACTACRIDIDYASKCSGLDGGVC